MAAPLITAITTVPNRENATNQASFSNDVDTFFSEVNGFQTEANAQAQYLDGVAAQVDADAATALSAKNSAVAAANYRGDWTVSSNVLRGESYTYLGKEWVAKQDSVGVTPVVGAFWIEGFGDAANVRYDNTASGLTATDVQGAIDEVEGGLGSSASLDATTSATDTTAERALKVGDFGVGGVAVINSMNDDFNGKFRVSLTATGDKPVGFSEGVADINGMGSDFVQTFKSFNDVNVIASRWYKNGLFTDYIYHYHSGLNAAVSEILAGSAVNKPVAPENLFNALSTANNEIFKSAMNAPGNANIYAVRAFISFNAVGAIRNAGGFSSVTVNGVGDYSANFSISPPNANFSATYTHEGQSYSSGTNILSQDVNSVRVLSGSNSSPDDADFHNINVVF